MPEEQRAGGTFVVAVDPDRCELHGECVLAAPGVFEIEDGADVVTVRVREPGPELQEEALEASYACPVQAIGIQRPADGA